jgi:hypothetical protein
MNTNTEKYYAFNFLYIDSVKYELGGTYKGGEIIALKANMRHENPIVSIVKDGKVENYYL